MRLRVNLQAKPNQIIPINYFHFLSSSIYHLLAKANLEFSSSLHQGEHLHGSKKFKFFTFSWLQIPKKQIVNSTIKLLSPEIFWFISSPWEEFVQYLVNGLLELGSIRVGEELFPITQVETLSDYLAPSPLTGEGGGEGEYKFLCLSPLVITTKKEHNGKLSKYYYKPTDSQEEISEKIKQNLINKYKVFYGKEPKNTSLKIEFDADYIKTPKAQVLIHYIKSLGCHSREGGNPELCHSDPRTFLSHCERKRNNLVSKKVQDKLREESHSNSLDIKIPAIMCPFVATGSLELIKFGYECGFGELNSAGFGMVRIV